MKKIKIRESRKHLRARIREAIATKKFRAECLARRILDDKTILEEPTLLEPIAIELRGLAYQIRALKNAKLAVEEA